MKTTFILFACLFALMAFAIVKKISSAGKTEFKIIGDKVYYFTPDGSVPLYRNKTLLNGVRKVIGADSKTFQVNAEDDHKGSDKENTFVNGEVIP